MTSALADRPSLPSAKPEEMRSALDAIVLQSISPVAAWLGLLYAALVFLHWLILPPGIAQQMSLLAACTAATLIVVRLVSRRQKIPRAWAYPLGALIVALVLVNSLVQIALTGEIYQTTNVMLVIAGMAFFVVSHRWFWGMLLVSLIGWILSILRIPFSELTVHFAVGLFGTAILAFALHLYHVQTLDRLVRSSMLEKQLKDQAESALGESRRVAERLRLTNAAMQSAANGIVITDRDGRILWINPAFTQMTGYTSAEAIGQTPRILKSGVQDQKFYEGLWQTILSGRVWFGELINRHKDGRLYIEEQTIGPVRNENGEISHFISVKQDVTLRKQGEELLVKRNRELAEMNSIIGAVTSSLNLDTVLNGIVNSVRSLLPKSTGASLQLLEEDMLVTRASTYPKWAEEQVLTFRPGRGAAGVALQENRIVNIGDVTQDQRFIPNERGARFLSLITTPIVYGERPMGVLSVEAVEKDAFSGDDEQLLTLLAGYVAVAIANAEYSGNLEEIVEKRTTELRVAQNRLLEQQRLEQEVRLAAEVQASLLPKQMPVIHGYEVAGTALPARLVSGDLYDCIVKNDGTCNFVLADISGKGIPAAMLTSTAHALLRAESEHTDSPSGILTNINKSLYRDLTRAELFITMFVARLNQDLAQVTYANAGHTEALWWRQSDLSCTRLGATGMPIGVMEGAEISEETIALRPGDVLVFYSDGITEAENPRQELFGVERLSELVRKYAFHATHTLAQRILTEVELFSGEAPRSDDLTLLVVKALPREFSFIFHSTLDNLNEALDLIHKSTEAYGAEFTYQFELASSEIITNIIQHAYRNHSGEIRFRLNFLIDRMELEIEDDGVPFDLTKLPEPDLEQPHERGYGLHVIRQLVDEVAYTPSTPQGNMWRLVKFSQEKK